MNKCSLPLAKAQCVHADKTGTSECPASHRVHELCPHRPGYVKELATWEIEGTGGKYDHIKADKRMTNVPIHLHDIISKQWDFNELKR